MQKKEHISALLQRYILNECTSEETEKVIAYFKQAKNVEYTPSVDDVLALLNKEKQKNTTSKLSFEQVLQTAKNQEAQRNNKRKSRGQLKFRNAAVAAIFIGIITTGYFFWQQWNTQHTLAIPPDAITLELEDGSIKILTENDTKELLNNNGQLLGKQTAKQISYKQNNNITKLVYNTLKVPYGKRFDLKLSDGTVVHLNAGTSIKYPVKFLKGQERRVYLSGEAFFGVSKDSLHPFVVNVNDLNVRVLGTQFNVSSYPEDTKTDVVLVEGSVGMHHKKETFNTTSSTILKPGFKGSFEKTNGIIETQAVLTSIYTAWIGGELVFRNMTFDNILKKLERHYNVSITNTNTRLAGEVFNASYGKISLPKVLEDLKLTHGITYKIEENNISIN